VKTKSLTIFQPSADMISYFSSIIDNYIC